MNGLFSKFIAHAAPRALVLLILIAAFFPTWQALVLIWGSVIGYAHGWLIAAIVAWLLLIDRTPLTLTSNPARTVIPLGALLLLYIFVRFAFIDLGEQLMLPIFAIALAYALYGRNGIRAFLFPSLYFLFAVPVWDLLIPPMQQATVTVVSHTLNWIGIPTTTYTDHIHIPSGTFAVERGCAGSHFLVVAFAVSTLNWKTWHLSTRKGLFAVVFASAMALIANWVRVFVIIVRAWMTDMQTGLIRNHYWFGWYLFAGVLLIYFLVVRQLDDGRKAPDAPAAPAAPVNGWRSLKSALPSIILVALVSLYVQVRLHALDVLVPNLPANPILNTTWQGPELFEPSWQPSFTGAAAHSMATYRGPRGREVSRYEAIYTGEHVGAKLIGYGSSAVPDSWTLLSQRLIARDKHSAYTRTPMLVEQSIAASTVGSRWLIWSWYEINGADYARPLQMKVAQGLQGFGLKTPAASKVIALATPCQSSCRQAQRELEEFSER